MRRPQEPASADPPSTPAPMVPSPSQGNVGPPAAPPRAKRPKPISWGKLARYIAEVTNGMEDAVDVMVEIATSPEERAQDRIKAIEFLAKQGVEPNPAMTKRDVTVSGPGGKPITHLHAHKVRVQLPDLSSLSDAELAEYERLMMKAASAPARALPAPAGAVLDAEVVDE